MHASNWQKQDLELEGWSVQLRSYLLGEQYLAEVEMVSSGVTIARATQKTREDAERRALDKAGERLRGSKRSQVDLMVGG